MPKRSAQLLTALLPSFFKTLVDHEVTVELKNDISIKGILKSVDQFLNIKLDDIQVVEEMKYPHLVSLAPFAPPSTNKSGSSRENRPVKQTADCTMVHLVVRQERLHTGQRRAIRALARGGGRRGSAGGCYEKRYARTQVGGRELQRLIVLWLSRSCVASIQTSLNDIECEEEGYTSTLPGWSAKESHVKRTEQRLQTRAPISKTQGLAPWSKRSGGACAMA